MSLKRCLLGIQEGSERLLMSTFAVVLTVIMLLTAQVQAGPPGQKVDDPYTFHGSEALPSGLIIVDVIDDLESDSSAHWSFNIGSDLYSETEFQWKPEQYAGASLALRCWPKDLEVLERTWCYPSRNVTATATWAEAEAIRVAFAWKKDIGHWMALYIDTASGSSFKHIINIGYGEYTIVNKVLNFSEFEHESGPDETIDPTQITKIAIGSSIGGNANNLYIHHLDLLRWFTRDSWLETSSSQPWNNLFEPGEPVTLTFAPGGTVPGDATGFRYEVQDYFGKIAAEGIVSWPVEQAGDEYHVDLGNLTGPGYYEVRAYWEGIDPPEQEFSIILEAPGGTMPFGLHTFAIMPQSKAQNRVEANESSFFGFHGPTPDLNSLMGNTWTLGSPRWDYIESTQPVRSSPDYMAQWAKDSIAQGPAPAYEFYLVNFVPMSTPDWVSQDNFFQDNWAHWADYEAFVCDMVRVQVARYPHVEHRVYDFMWEVSLYMDTEREPNMSVEQVMNVYERVRPIVLEEDPDALIIGICPSQPGMNADWWIPFFEAGVLDYLDGLSLHPYHSVAPENARIPTVVHDIEALTAQYNDGVTLPIWMTEWGYQSMQGGVSNHHRDAQYRVRANLILQGTGARASMPFFGRDYDAPWGVMFRLGKWQGFPQVDPLAPKPSVVALAVQSALLDGAISTGNLNGLGGDAHVWDYTFEDGGRNIFVIWRTNHDDALVDLPIPAGVNQVIVYDMMGQSRVKPVSGSTLSMRLSMDVQYVTRRLKTAVPPYMQEKIFQPIWVCR